MDYGQRQNTSYGVGRPVQTRGACARDHLTADVGTQVYEELDESLTKAFEEYLRERGVDEALGAYLVEAVHDKEQREYQAWLERVQTFLHAK